MIVLRMMGRLGNQMFQYAYARALQEIYKEPIVIDNSVYKKYRIGEYSLTNLNIRDDIKEVSKYNIRKLDYLVIRFWQKFYHVFQKLKRIIFNTDVLGEHIFYYFSKKGLYFNFDRYYYPSLIINKKNKSIYGYFQSEKYFKEISDQIKKELKVVTEPSNQARKMLDEILGCNAVGVSIRCGHGYINTGLDVCNPEYYYKGMDIVACKVYNPVFFIFSDRIDIVKETYKFSCPVKYIENMPDYESLRLLYSCKHFVIANSSFSWFGAYLSDNASKIVIAPSKWYKKSNKRPDIFLESMTLIDV